MLMRSETVRLTNLPYFFEIEEGAKHCVFNSKAASVPGIRRLSKSYASKASLSLPTLEQNNVYNDLLSSFKALCCPTGVLMIFR